MSAGDKKWTELVEGLGPEKCGKERPQYTYTADNDDLPASNIDEWYTIKGKTSATRELKSLRGGRTPWTIMHLWYAILIPQMH